MSFFAPSAPKQQPLPPPPTMEDPAVKEAAEREAAAARKAKGRSATLLTGATGVNDNANVQKARLLG